MIIVAVGCGGSVVVVVVGCDGSVVVVAVGCGDSVVVVAMGVWWQCGCSGNEGVLAVWSHLQWGVVAVWL